MSGSYDEPKDADRQVAAAVDPPWDEGAARPLPRGWLRRGAVALTVVAIVGVVLPCWPGRFERCESWCGLGLGHACHVNGFAYDVGLDAPVDDDRAARYYRRGCDAGFARSCLYLGMMNEAGEGMPVDLTAAEWFYQQSCPGEPRACRFLARVRHQLAARESQESR